MEEIAEELVVIITSFLDQNAIRALASVSKKMHRIAQEVLYRSPAIPPAKTYAAAQKDDSRLSSLVRTFVHRPDLANLVRRLELHPEARVIGFDTSTLPGVSPAAIDVLRNTHVNHLESSLAGMIIKLAPNLEELYVEVLSRRSRGRHKYAREYCLDGSYALFENFRKPGINIELDRNLSSIAGLRNLKKLRIAVGELECCWYRLPSLTELYVYRGCWLTEYCPQYVPGRDSIQLTSGVRRLTLERAAFIFSEEISAMKRLLTRMGCLTTLTLIISNYHYTPRAEDNENYPDQVSYCLHKDSPPGFCDVLLAKLAGVATTLEVLEIIIAEDEHEDASCLLFISPATRINFKKLSRLQIPNELLVATEPGALTAHPTALLPSSLEKLEITYPFHSFTQFLRGMVENLEYFANLQEVSIFPHAERGDGNDPKFRNATVWEELENLGIKVHWKASC